MQSPRKFLPAAGALVWAWGMLLSRGAPAVVAPPLSPQESLAKIHVRPDFQVDLVAAEPLLESPVAIDWDEKGRLWVVEMVDYPLGLDGKGKPGGRVRCLTDSDGDGRYDQSTFFAEGLKFPTGILTWRDGVLVTAAPEILFLQDTNGDGIADVRTVLFSGFLEGNQQLRVNGLRWGMDNWVYCASGAHHGGYGTSTKIKSGRNGQEYVVGSRDFRFRPDTGELEPQSGPSQFGRNPNDWGDWFGVQNSWPLWHYVLQDHYIRRNPYVPAPDPVHQVVTPKNPTVYPASRQEKRFHSFNEAGHFTSACAAMIYRDDLLFGVGTESHAFTCEPFHNVVQHNIVFDDGVSFSARRDPVESPYDFFASEDRWCRPVMTRTGPDGALWVVDMYRYMIEHPEWLPAEGKAELLPHYRLGEERGRIYRVYPKARSPRPRLRLEGLRRVELIAALDSPNGWQRDKVQMMLVWQGGLGAAAGLETLATESADPRVRLQAIATLEGLGALRPEIVEQALSDAHPGVRRGALRFAETHATPGVRKAARQRVADVDPKVRLQLACTLGEWPDAETGAALAHLAVTSIGDPMLTSAVLSSALPHQAALVESAMRAGGPTLVALSDRLLTLVLATGQRDLLARLLEPILGTSRVASTEEQFKSFGRFLETLSRRQTTWRNLRQAGQEDELSRRLNATEDLFAAARQWATDERRPGAERVAAAGLLVRDEVQRKEMVPVLASLLSAKVSGEVQREAIRALSVSGDVGVPEVWAAAWSSLGPESRLVVLDELLSREAYAVRLAEFLERGTIPTASLDATRRARLLRHSSAQVKEIAGRAFSSGTNSSRAKVVEAYRPALRLDGDATRGRSVFRKSCAPCHQLGGIGMEIGPNLQSVVNHPAEKLLISILDPNASIEPGYTAYTARLTNGDELYGIIVAETGNSLVLKLSDGKIKTLLRSDLTQLTSGNLSLMPEGLEAGLSPADLADLIQFLRTP